MGERLARLGIAVEGQEHRPNRIGEPAVGHHHIEDGLRLARDGVPHPDRLEQPLRRRHDGGSARVMRRGVQCGIGDRDAEAIAQPLAQRHREREPGDAGAADEHIGVAVTREVARLVGGQIHLLIMYRHIIAFGRA